jgi:hypothetical protein
MQEWQTMALKLGKIKDKIIDEHAILLYIEYSAEREKKTRRGAPIAGSRLGAVCFLFSLSDFHSLIRHIVTTEEVVLRGPPHSQTPRRR